MLSSPQAIKTDTKLAVRSSEGTGGIIGLVFEVSELCAIGLECLGKRLFCRATIAGAHRDKIMRRDDLTKGGFIQHAVTLDMLEEGCFERGVSVFSKGSTNSNNGPSNIGGDFVGPDGTTDARDERGCPQAR